MVECVHFFDYRIREISKLMRFLILQKRKKKRAKFQRRVGDALLARRQHVLCSSKFQRCNSTRVLLALFFSIHSLQKPRGCLWITTHGRKSIPNWIGGMKSSNEARSQWSNIHHQLRKYCVITPFLCKKTIDTIVRIYNYILFNRCTYVRPL